METKSNLKRIQAEKNLLTKEIVQANIIEESKDEQENPIWKISIPGPDGSPYKNYRFIIQVTFKNYPFSFPDIVMITPIFHPDIDSTGQFCLQMLESDKWVPSKKLHQIINLIIAMLLNPSGENSLNKEATEIFKSDVKKFNQKAQEHAKKNAIKN
ncbi:Ubiquitin-conjugating enzyme/RWD-like protein [Pseudocohnilembus persalinus]|uniref:Ubiquitin-conjugating enzyme/RWD-like protein n=1 Tax=Pseudocohnilembus persalinus TaxID=266149 RepID=A0A0V0QRK1_PSEPJ|nr:Ubiquitin-conjugating enzyme/RWD-like protein [Pseudocohnilembus persalinus]|eukprot:KRX04886.1 Ubiquitin-conjugating enzyme/RWD-like protein [Pseudocohnilembus persalinus]